MPRLAARDESRPCVLVIRPGALGDFVLTFPALQLARRAFPGRALACVCRSEFGAFAVHVGIVDEYLSEDCPAVVGLYSGSPAGAGRSRDPLGRVEAAVSFTSSEELVRGLLASGVGEILSATARPPEGAAVHASEHLAAALRPRTGAVPAPMPLLEISSATRAHARELLARSGLEPQRFMAIHPGSGGTRKNWPAERFAELASGARRELGLGIAVLLGPAELDREEARPDPREALAPVADAVFESPRLPLLAGLLAEAAVYVGNDSGVSHLAAAASAPTIAIFGPTDPAVWAPRGGRVRVLRDPSGELDRVTVADVLQAADSLAAS